MRVNGPEIIYFFKKKLYLIYPLFLKLNFVGKIKETKMGPIRSIIGGKKNKIGPFCVVVFHENNSSKSKFISKGAELFWAPQI